MTEETKVEVKNVEDEPVKIVSMKTIKLSDAENKDSNKTATLAQLFSTADNHDITLMITGSLAAIVTGGCLPAFCVLFGKVIDALNNGSSIRRAVDEVCLIFVIVGAVNIVSGYIQVMSWVHAGERQAQRLRMKYVKSVLSQEVGWFDTCGASEINTLVTELTGKVQDGITRRTGDLIQFTSQFIVAFVAAFYLNWNLTVVLIATFPLIAASGTFMIRAITSAQNESSDQYAKAGGLATEALSAIRTVTALNAQPYVISKYREFIIDAMNIGTTKSFKVGFGNGMTFCISFFTYALGFWYGAKLIADQQDDGCSHNCYSGGTIISVFFCVIVGSTALGQISPPLSVFFSAKAAAGTMLETIDRKPLIDGLSEEGERPYESPKGHIEIKNIIFAYPSRPSINVCNNYSLTIYPGETVALCGPSGAGKSTIINLLLRFYDPQSGQITLDGRDIRSLNIKWLRNCMGYVGQEPVLFAGSVADNIAYGIDRDVETNLTDEEIQRRVEEAAKQANAHGFITGFPKGYQTDVGGNGLSLSGGQKQRIAIARALVKKPAVLLLDEATSALDAASERLVQKSIDMLQQSKSQTTIVIAHRLSTIRNADKIAVINEGRVVEMGTHDELLAKNGLYADLVKLQMSTPEDDLATAVNQSLRNALNEDESVLEELARKKTMAKELEESGTSAKRKTNEKNSLSTTATATTATTATGGGSNKNSGSSSGSNNKLSDKQKRKARLAMRKNKKDEEKLDKEESKRLRSKIIALILPYSHWMILGLIGAMLVGAAFPVWGLLIAQSENMFYLETHELRRQSVLVAERFIYLGIDCLVGYTLQFYCIGQVGHRIVTTLRSDLFESLFRRETGFFDFEQNSVGVLTANLAEDTRLVYESTGETFANQLQACFTLLVGLIIGFTASWKITLVVIATFPLNIVASSFRAKARTGQIYNDASGESDNYSGALSSAFTHMRTVSAFSMQKKVGELYEAATEEVCLSRQGRSHVDGLALGVTNAIMFFSYALLFWYGSRLVTDGEIDFNQLMTAILGLLIGAIGLGQALNDIGDQQEGLLAAKRIFANIEEARRSSIDGLSKEGIIPASHRVEGKIELRGIQFHYPTRPEAQVCNDYNLVINPGELIALVGPSGSGKSTIMNLLLRFYDPLEGQILFDGVDIKTLNIRWLRSQIGYVGQEPVLFTGSIADNIAKGRAEAANDEVRPLSEILLEREKQSRFPCSSYKAIRSNDMDENQNEDQNKNKNQFDIESGSSQEMIPQDILEAAKLSNAHDFITTFTQGYDTEVGEGSVMVSGGQKQRIAIARALVKKPAVLLLDEATSALDAASERLVQQSIDMLQQSHSQTTIVIAHRLSTIRNADKIAVINEGRVVEMGTHDELLAKNGLYSHLWEKQAGLPDTK